jgi:hypothetical protein
MLPCVATVSDRLAVGRIGKLAHPDLSNVGEGDDSCIPQPRNRWRPERCTFTRLESRTRVRPTPISQSVSPDSDKWLIV